ncbi:MAG: histidine kinase [Lachnospiraceae bacterium]|nr:histidine kinase [Lachnospiraceae bacterium]
MSLKKLSRLHYISNRVLLMGGIGFIFLLIQSFVSLFFCFHGNVGFWLFILYFLLFLGWSAAFLFWIIHPYFRTEQLTRRFLDGYILDRKQNVQMALLTPSSKEQWEAVERVLHSPQLMELNKRQAQYLALQNQINPHFLYNTLESIRGEALIAGLDSVADMTEALAKFFRYTITKVENLVSVEEELDNCETYFRIQQYRFGDRLKLHVEYEEEDYEEIMSCQIPKLTLQPILENSIIHGIEPKVGVGNLKIRFERTESRLIIWISDNGVGMDDEVLAKLNRHLGRDGKTLEYRRQEERGGIALVNVNNRIHLIFGEEYGMHVYSMTGAGTDVEITLPITVTEEEIREKGIL